MLADFSFYNVVLAVHIAAVVAAFGVIFAYPILLAAIGRSDPRALPALHRVQRLGTRLLVGGLVVIVVAGIYLASDHHAWKDFYVQWGVGATLVLGALAGAYLSPRERRLIELSERDVAAAGTGAVGLGADYRALSRQVLIADALADGLVLLTILFMATRLGGS